MPHLVWAWGPETPMALPLQLSFLGAQTENPQLQIKNKCDSITYRTYTSRNGIRSYASASTLCHNIAIHLRWGGPDVLGLRESGGGQHAVASDPTGFQVLTWPCLGPEGTLLALNGTYFWTRVPVTSVYLLRRCTGQTAVSRATVLQELTCGQ